MSETAELAGYYSVIENTAGLLDITCAQDKVWPILNVYGSSLPQAVLAFRMASGARHAGELDCRFTMAPGDVDPYSIALSNGLIEKTDHPVGALLSEIHGRFPVDCWAVDFGVVGGFTKTWSFFPADDMQKLSDLAELPSMPSGVAENADLFARYGVHDNVSLIGIDYSNRTVNVYFGAAPAECFEPKTIRSMLRDMELPEPSEEMLTLGQQAFGIYATLSWDSPKVRRICFAVMTPDPLTLPVQIDPKIAQFVKSYPYGGDDRKFVYAVTSSPKGEYYKLQAYYQWRAQMSDRMLVSESVEEPA
jgi:hypothetical protein